MLTLKNLTTGYGRTPISRNLCATLPAGTLTALLGANGTGKSTLLRTIAGLQPPLRSTAGGAEGSIAWQGKNVCGLPPRALARLMSVVLTLRPATGTLTASEVIELGRIPHGKLLGGVSDEDRRQVERAMQLTDTLPFRNRPIGRLSDGERQRVLIAKALAQNTPLILLDEPTAFLDFTGKAATLRLLARLAHEEGKTVLVSTHDVELALALCDRLWLLGGGGITEGTPRELADGGVLKNFFAGGEISFDSRTMRFYFFEKSHT